MKKLYSLLAMAAVAISASAQGTYDAGSETADIPYNTKITSVDNITMIYGDNDEASSDAADFKAPLDKYNQFKETYGFTGATEGNGQNGNKAQGTIYTFIPNLDGTLEVGLVLNAYKAIIVKQGNVSGTDVDFTLTDNKGNEVAVTDLKVEEKTYGIVKLDVAAGETYVLGISGSKAGFYGFKYETSSVPTAVQGVKAAEQGDGVVYDLNGRKVKQPVAGQVYIKNGKKFIQK